MVKLVEWFHVCFFMILKLYISSIRLDPIKATEAGILVLFKTEKQK